MRNLICIWVLIAVLLGPLDTIAGEIVLVTHPQNPVSVLEQDEVKKIFLGKVTRWENGAPVHVYVQKQEKINAEFLEQIVKKTPRQFFLYWKRALFSGTGTPPPTVADDEAMKKAVASSVTSLGYIQSRSLDSSVKVVDMD